MIICMDTYALLRGLCKRWSEVISGVNAAVPGI